MCVDTSDIECTDQDNLNNESNHIIPFIACGDLRGLDSNRTYPFDMNSVLGDLVNSTEYVPLDPIQPPIDAPYKSYLEWKRKVNYS